MVVLAVLSACVFSTPTYEQHIRPLFERSCLPCHIKGGVAPFSLDTFSRVRARLDLIRTVTLSKQMPPYRSYSEVHSFDPVSELSDAELILFQEWMRAGSPQGPSRFSGTKTRSASVPSLEVLSPTSVIDEEGDPYWVAFRMLTPTEQVTFTGLQVHALAPKSLRRVDIAIVATEVLKNQVKWRSKGRLPDSSRTVATWAPGYASVKLPQGTGIRIEPGEVLIAQGFYQPTGKPEPGGFVLRLEKNSDEVQKVLGHRIEVRDFEVPVGKTRRIDRVWRISEPIRLVSLHPYARRFAAELDISIESPGKEPVVLFHQNFFNWLWVGSYHLPNGLVISENSQVRVRAIYDNTEHCSANAGRKLEPVRFGDGRFDEMFCVDFSYLPVDGAN